MRKILILITDAGAGHRSAANALEKVITKNYSTAYQSQIVDILKIVGVEPYSSGDEIYSDVSNYKILEFFHNIFFGLLNGEIGFEVAYNDLVKKIYNGFEKFILDYDPDIVISIHPTVSMLLSEFKKRNPNFKTVTVVTDLGMLNRGWADKLADIVVSPSSKITQQLLNFGVNSNKIIDNLFPIDPNIQNFRDSKIVLQELGFTKEQKTILITSGGSATGKLIGLIKKLVKSKNFQLIIITGKKHALKKKLEKLFSDNSMIKILGFVNNISDYYNCSDLIIGKPGPATILEVSLFNKKMILTSKVGKQEEENIEYALTSPNFFYSGNKKKRILDGIYFLLNSDVGISLGRKFNEAELILEKILG